MSFLPTDYKEPVTSNYVKLEDGDTTLRLLGSFSDGTAVMGQEYWKTIDGKKKPFRLAKGVAVPIADLEETDDEGNLKMPVFFWAIPVYNVGAEKIQIFKITQKTIRQPIQTLVGNPKWGDPTAYNIVITRAKENGKTSYSVTPEPKEKLDKKILDMYEGLHINMSVYLSCGDPFAQESTTTAMSEEDTEEITDKIPF